MYSIIEKNEMIERVHHLIRRKATGSPSDLASVLDISHAKLYRLLNTMRTLGAPIIFNYINQRYEYEYEVEFHYGFTKLEFNSNKELNRLAVKKILQK
jgi:predicted DNA-binding transcriptional regulator YafY